MAREWGTEILLYRVDDAARKLGVGRSTMWGLISNGEIRVVRLGRSTRVPASELHAYVRRLEAEAGWSETKKP